MFRKILIANRGEIACRIITTAQKMGIQTVAVYSDADRNAKHVALADQAVHIGPAAVADSYLQGQKIIDACLKTGAEAVHPGYGFLSENPEFVTAVEKAGLIFIGPPASAINDMGLKDAAKALMTKAGVQVVPGYHGQDQDPKVMAAQADKIGYPVLIKARAGGGGKGMRKVDAPADFAAALESAQREADASFGDPICLIEKYITTPRHIEIQVFADNHGNAIHVFERDCSLQRRHQKVIEEAPAPDMPQDVRDAMGQAAVNAAKAIGYTGAGTVEFIVDGSGPLRVDGFWFMEMNTRLQVEHPVSEAITGLDFVELQLRIAAEDPLPITQEDLAIDGWAFEARIYAEDVPKGFLPATGTLAHLAFPAGVEFELGGVRIDSGVRQGDDISPWYDPMIAKVIVHGPTRDAALNRLTAALAECRVVGCETNIEFLHALSRHEGFAEGQVDTGLIARDLDGLTKTSPPSDHVVSLAALAAQDLLRAGQTDDFRDALIGWRHWGAAVQSVRLEQPDTSHEVMIAVHGNGQFTTTHNDTELGLTIDPITHARFGVAVGDVQHMVDIVTQPGAVHVFENGQSFTFTLPDPLETGAADATTGDALIAPMPGLVGIVSTSAGQRVAKGDVLVVLEAMKMEHALCAPRDGIVAEVLVAAGDQVTDGTTLLAMEPEDD